MWTIHGRGFDSRRLHQQESRGILPGFFLGRPSNHGPRITIPNASYLSRWDLPRSVCAKFGQVTTADDWRTRLATAVARDDVVATAREFIDSRPPHVWARLPRELRPGPMDRTDDVTAYALSLLERECTLQGDAAADHYELMEFFAAATQRLAHMGRPRFPASK